MYLLAANSDYLLEIQMVGRLHGQVTRNVFHYHFKPGDDIDDGSGFVQAVLAEWATDVASTFLVGMSNEYAVREITGQVIDPVRYRKEFRPGGGEPALAGEVVQNSLPSAVCAVVSMYGDVADPTFQGRKYFPGIPVTFEEDSKLNEDGMDWLNIAAIGCITEMVVAGITVRPTIAKNGASTALVRQVTATVARDILRIQRRREVGVGE